MDRDEVNPPQEEEAPGRESKEADSPMTQGLSAFKDLDVRQIQTRLVGTVR